MRYLRLLLITLTTISLSGCIRIVRVEQTVQPTAPTSAIIAFVDISGSVSSGSDKKAVTSWQAGMKNQLRVLFQLVREQKNGTTWVEIYAMGGTKVFQVYKDRPRKATDIGPELKSILKNGPAKEEGTWFAPAFVKLGQRSRVLAEHFPKTPVVALFLTDGGVDDLDKATPAGKLAADNKVRGPSISKRLEYEIEIELAGSSWPFQR